MCRGVCQTHANTLFPARYQHATTAASTLPPSQSKEAEAADWIDFGEAILNDRMTRGLPMPTA
jgi:hypothetical protein